MRIVRDYTPEEVATIDSGVQLVFSRDDVRPSPAASYRVRFHDMLEAFTIYPRTDRDLVVNELIWRAVKDSSFRSCLWPARLPVDAADDEDTQHLGRHENSVVFALGIPDQLVSYLQCVSLDEMYESILCMLADAARSEDEDGMESMREELAPSIWNDLEFLLSEGQTRGQRFKQNSMLTSAAAAPAPYSPLEESDGMELENDISDRTSTMATESQSATLWRGQESCMYASYLLDQALHVAQDHDFWQIPITGATFEPTDELATDTHDNDQAVMIHSLYNDWQLYAKNCMIASPPTPTTSITGGHTRPPSPLAPALGPNGMLRVEEPTASTIRRRTERKQVLSTMMTLVQEQRQGATWARAATVLSCAKRSESYLASLPHHVVQHCILPKVVLEEECPAAADETKSVAIFQTLDMSPPLQSE